MVDLVPFEHDANTSPIGRGILGLLDGPLRIRRPAVRRGWLEGGPGSTPERRGQDSFVELEWADALSLVATELERVRGQQGNQAIYGGSYGWASAGRFHHAQSQLKRFLNCIGGFVNSVDTYSFAAAEVVMPRIIGNFHKLLDDTTSWPVIAEHTELFVALGGLPLRNSQVNSGGLGSHTANDHLLEAARSGVKFVNVGPMRRDMPAMVECDWLAIRPGSDTALLLSIAWVLWDETLHDQAFLDRYTVGFETFRAYLAGDEDGTAKTPDWASRLCDIPAAQIRDLARRMAASRTMISVAWSLTRQSHGEQNCWVAVAVAAMLGQIGQPGGGFGFGYLAVNAIGNHYSIVKAKSFPQGRNPVGAFIPVARISDMLLNPGTDFDYDGVRYSYPDIDLIYWAGGNPFHHHQDLNRLALAWRKPSTIIVNDWCWNSLARRADIVLPCTTPLERNDFAAARDPFIIAMQKAVEPFAESMDDFQIFRGLAARLGVGPAFDEGRTDQQWQAAMYQEMQRRGDALGIDLPDYQTLRETGYARLAPPPRARVMLTEFRRDPDRHALRTPSGRIEITSPTVASFGYEECPGYPAWREPFEWLGSSDRGQSLHLISPQPATRLHSQLDHGAVSAAKKPGGREPVVLNPADASARGISDGDLVLLANRRGKCLATAQLESGLRPGVCAMATGAWFDPSTTEGDAICCNGNPNILTHDMCTSRLAQGPAAQSCLVTVTPFRGTPPPVKAYRPPTIQPSAGEHIMADHT